MFGQPTKVKPRAVSKDLELYDLCGYRIPEGRSSKPVGPDRKVFFKGNGGKRSTTVPLSSAASGSQLSPEEKTKEMKKHFKKGFTAGWYDDRGEGVQTKGPSLTDFQRAMQQHRETQACIPGFSYSKSDKRQQGLTNPITGETLPPIGESVPRSIGRSVDWENDYQNLYTTVPGNEYPPSSSALASSPAQHPMEGRRGPGVLSSTVFGTMQVDSPEKLQRMKDITQDNIMKTRRLRAGIPEPVQGIDEASKKAFKRESKVIKKASKEANNNTQEVTDLMPSSTVGGTVGIMGAYPYERQLQGRKMRDAKRMEEELAKAMTKLNPVDVEKSVPKYRSTSRAASNFSPTGVMY